MKFEVIHKDTPGALDKIDKKELGMLVKLLKSIEHPYLKKAVDSYGCNEECTKWNDKTLAKYKKTTLNDRMNSQGYRFYILKDNEGEVLALASGDLSKDKKKFEIRNFIVNDEDNGKKSGVDTYFIGKVTNSLAKQGVKEATMRLSKYAQKHGDVESYERILNKLGVKIKDDSKRKHTDLENPEKRVLPGSIELVFVPEIIKNLEIPKIEDKPKIKFEILKNTPENKEKIGQYIAVRDGHFYDHGAQDYKLVDGGKYDKRKDTIFIVMSDDKNRVMGGLRLIQHLPGTDNKLKAEDLTPIKMKDALNPKLDIENMHYLEISGNVEHPDIRGKDYGRAMFKEAHKFIKEELKPDFFIMQPTPEEMQPTLDTAKEMGVKQIHNMREVIIPWNNDTRKEIADKVNFVTSNITDVSEPKVVNRYRNIVSSMKTSWERGDTITGAAIRMENPNTGKEETYALLS